MYKFGCHKTQDEHEVYREGRERQWSVSKDEKTGKY